VSQAALFPLKGKPPEVIHKSAVFSPCRTWRYVLERVWWPRDQHRVPFLGLNPSTADEIEDDPTVRRCLGYAKQWGFGGMIMLNIFAFRATNPRVMKAAADPVGPDNDGCLTTVANRVTLVVAAWGNDGAFRGRSREVVGGGLAIRLYTVGFGNRETKLAEGKTDDQGFCALTYDPGDKAANLDIRAVDAQGQEISLCATKFDADRHEVLNLVAPMRLRKLAPEYRRLTADLKQQLAGLEKLGEARETAAQRDLTLLKRATGWDARLIALAATAQKLSAATKMTAEALYGLFRAGLPTSKERLAALSPEVVAKALKKAAEAGLVGLYAKQTEKAVKAFTRFARTVRRAARDAGQRRPGQRGGPGQRSGRPGWAQRHHGWTRSAGRPAEYSGKRRVERRNGEQFHRPGWPVIGDGQESRLKAGRSELPGEDHKP